jgi:hypothetical protein
VHRVHCSLGKCSFAHFDSPDILIVLVCPMSLPEVPIVESSNVFCLFICSHRGRSFHSSSKFLSASAFTNKTGERLHRTSVIVVVIVWMSIQGIVTIITKQPQNVFAVASVETHFLRFLVSTLVVTTTYCCLLCLCITGWLFVTWT